MASRANKVKKSIREQKGAGWTVLKMALGLVGAFFIIIALIGMMLGGAHGQNNMTNFAASHADQMSDSQAAKGCIGNDQTTGRTYIDTRCLNDWKLVAIMCDN